MAATSSIKPRALVTFGLHGHDTRAWLLLDDRYVEVSSVCSGINLEANCGVPTELVLRIPVAAVGEPDEVQP